MSLEGKAPKVVLFDWDGTLADSFGFLQAAHDHCLKALGLPVEPDGWFHGYFGKSRDYIYSTLYGDQAEAAKTMFTAFVRDHHVDVITPLPEAEALLKALKSKGALLGIVTNKIPDLVLPEIEAFGWGHYFSVVVGAGEAGEDKPSPMPLFLALERSGYQGDINDVWFVGDTIADYEASQTAGSQTILVGGFTGKDAYAFEDIGAFYRYFIA